MLLFIYSTPNPKLNLYITPSLSPNPHARSLCPRDLASPPDLASPHRQPALFLDNCRRLRSNLLVDRPHYSRLLTTNLLADRPHCPRLLCYSDLPQTPSSSSPPHRRLRYFIDADPLPTSDLLPSPISVSSPHHRPPLRRSSHPPTSASFLQASSATIDSSASASSDVVSPPSTPPPSTPLAPLTLNQRCRPPFLAINHSSILQNRQ